MPVSRDIPDSGPDPVGELIPHSLITEAAIVYAICAMSGQEREQWYRDHPVSDYEDAAALRESTDDE